MADIMLVGKKEFKGIEVAFYVLDGKLLFVKKQIMDAIGYSERTHLPLRSENQILVKNGRVFNSMVFYDTALKLAKRSCIRQSDEFYEWLMKQCGTFSEFLIEEHPVRIIQETEQYVSKLQSQVDALMQTIEEAQSKIEQAKTIYKILQESGEQLPEDTAEYLQNNIQKLLAAYKIEANVFAEKNIFDKTSA